MADDLEDVGPAGGNPNASRSQPNFPDADSGGGGGGGGGSDDGGGDDGGDSRSQRVPGVVRDAAGFVGIDVPENAQREPEPEPEPEPDPSGGDGGGGIVDTVQERASDAVDTVQDTAQNVRDRVESGADNTPPEPSQEEIDRDIADAGPAGSVVDDPDVPNDQEAGQRNTGPGNKTGKGPFPDSGPAGSNPNVATGDVNLPDVDGPGDLTDELADGNLTRSEVVAETEDVEYQQANTVEGIEQVEERQGPLGEDPARQEAAGLELESGRVAQQARQLEERVLRESAVVSDQQDVRVVQEDGQLQTRLTEQGQTDVAQQAAAGSSFDSGGFRVSPTGDVELTDQGRETQAVGQAGLAASALASQFAEPANAFASAATETLNELQQASARAEAEKQAATQASAAVRDQFGPSFQRGEDFTVETSVQDGRVAAETDLTREGRTTLGERSFREQFPQVQDPTRGEDFRIDREGDGFEIQITDQGEQRIRDARQGEEEFGDIPAVAGVKVDDQLRGAGDALSENVIQPAANIGAAAAFAPIEAGVGVIPGDRPNVQRGLESAEGTFETSLRSGGELFNVPNTTATLIEAGEFAGEGLAETVQGDAGEYANRATTAGVEAVEGGLDRATESPQAASDTLAALGGGLLASTAAIGAAGAASSTAGRATALTVQPGEEIATFGANRLLQGTRVGNAVLDNRIFQGRLDNEEPLARAAVLGGQRARQGLSSVNTRVRSGLSRARDIGPSVDVSVESNPNAGVLDVNRFSSESSGVRGLENLLDESSSVDTGVRQAASDIRSDIGGRLQGRALQAEAGLTRGQEGVEDLISQSQAAETGGTDIAQSLRDDIVGRVQGRQLQAEAGLTQGTEGLDDLIGQSQAADTGATDIARGVRDDLVGRAQGRQLQAEAAAGRARRRLGEIDPSEAVLDASRSVDDRVLRGQRAVEGGLLRGQQGLRRAFQRGRTAAQTGTEGVEDLITESQDADVDIREAVFGTSRAIDDAVLRAQRGVETQVFRAQNTFNRGARGFEDVVEQSSDADASIGGLADDVSDLTLRVDIGRPSRRTLPADAFETGSADGVEFDTDDLFSSEAATETETETRGRSGSNVLTAVETETATETETVTETRTRRFGAEPGEIFDEPAGSPQGRLEAAQEPQVTVGQQAPGDTSANADDVTPFTEPGTGTDLFEDPTQDQTLEPSTELFTTPSERLDNPTETETTQPTEFETENPLDPALEGETTPPSRRRDPPGVNFEPDNNRRDRFENPFDESDETFGSGILSGEQAVQRFNINVFDNSEGSSGGGSVENPFTDRSDSGDIFDNDNSGGFGL